MQQNSTMLYTFPNFIEHGNAVLQLLKLHFIQSCLKTHLQLKNYCIDKKYLFILTFQIKRHFPWSFNNAEFSSIVLVCLLNRNTNQSSNALSATATSYDNLFLLSILWWNHIWWTFTPPTVLTFMYLEHAGSNSIVLLEYV